MLDYLSAYFGSENQLTTILWPILIGIILGIALSVGMNLTVGAFFKRLFVHNADSPTTAKTLAELGYKQTFFLKLALRRGSTVRKLVLLADAEPQNAELSQEDAKTAQNCDVVESAETEDSAKTDVVQSEFSQEDAVLEEAEPPTAREIDPALVAAEENRMCKPDFTCGRWYLNPATREQADTLYNQRNASPLAITLAAVALFGLTLAAFYLIPLISDLAASIF